MNSNDSSTHKNISSEIKNTLLRLWRQIAAKRRKQILLIIILTIFTSSIEIISLGAIAPFLIALSSPHELEKYLLVTQLIAYLKINDSTNLALFFAVLFGMAALIAGTMRLSLQWYTTRFCYAIGADFNIKIYEGVLHQPYLKHINRNSSEIISGLTKSNSLVTGILQPIFSLISALPILILILVALVYANALIAFVTIILLIFVYAIIMKLVYRRIEKDSVCVAREQQLALKHAQEGLGGIRDIIIDNSQKIHLNRYINPIINYQKALASIFIVCNIPRYGVEMFGLILISISTFIIALTDGGIKNAIPILGFMALAAQRFLPLLQQSYSAVMTIKGNGVSAMESLDLLEDAEKFISKDENITPIPFRKNIIFKNVDFSYVKGSKKIINELSIEIQKGARIGIIGESGVGKSTFLDIFMALVAPDAGGLYVDGVLITNENRKAWQKRIAHVPQDIYLLDGTVIENIAFGVPSQSVDMKLVVDAVRRANMEELIESWPLGYETNIGERGSKLSGGQRQRLAIARALYKRADILIFDEATSALDEQTERDLIKSLFLLDSDITLVMVSHRPSSLQEVDQLFKFQFGKLLNVNKSS